MIKVKYKVKCEQFNNALYNLQDKNQVIPGYNL